MDFITPSHDENLFSNKSESSLAFLHSCFHFCNCICACICTFACGLFHFVFYCGKLEDRVHRCPPSPRMQEGPIAGTHLRQAPAHGAGPTDCLGNGLSRNESCLFSPGFCLTRGSRKSPHDARFLWWTHTAANTLFTR